MKFLKHHKSLVLLLAIFLGALILRTLFLDRVLSGVLNDELKFVFNAKAVWLTGSSAYGGWNPLSLNGDPHGFYDNELVPLLMAPFIGVLPYALYFVRLPFAVISILDVVVLYFIGKKIFGKSEAITIAAVATINPYLILLGRVGTESQIAMFFFLLGVLCLLYFRGWRLLISCIPFFIAFYSYVGTKITFLPFVFVVTAWCAFVYNKKNIKQYAFVFLFAVLVVIFFVIRIKHQSVGGRVEELLLPNSPVIARMVDEDRRQSFVSPLTSLYTNKFSAVSYLFIKNYADVFNPTVLFVTGEVSAQLSLWNTGYFYLIDLIPLIYGLFLLAKTNKKSLLLLVGILIVSPIAGALRADPGGSFINHGNLFYPTVLLIIGYGLYHLCLLLWKKKKILVVLIILLYGYVFSSFLQTYFFRMPIYNAEGPLFSRRLLAKYITFEKTKAGHVYVFAHDPFNTFLSYLVYTSAYNSREDALTVRKVLHEGEKTSVYTLGNVVFTNEQTPITMFSTNAKDTIIFGETMKGQPLNTWLNIPDLTSGGSVYRIYFGKTCSQQQLNRYPQRLHFSSLSVESLSEKSFCETFITKY